MIVCLFVELLELLRQFNNVKWSLYKGEMIKFGLFSVNSDLFLTSLAQKVRIRTFSANADHSGSTAPPNQPQERSIFDKGWLGGSWALGGWDIVQLGLGLS